MSETAILQAVRPLTWSDVFEMWHRNEEQSESWAKYWQERGFASWEEWRGRFAEALELPEKTWGLWYVENPREAVPQFRGGPFRGWAEQFYEGRTLPTFAEIATHPGIQAHEYVLKLLNDFPRETTIAGLRLTNQDIVVIEGMHRSAAIALATLQERPLTTTLFLALAEAGTDTLPVIGQFRKE